MVTYHDQVARDRTAALALPCTTSWREAFRVAWAVYLPVRLLLSLYGAAVQWVRWTPPPNLSPFGWLDWLLVRPWAGLDVEWYAMIARTGYGVADGRAAFHPLLPLLMRLIGDLLGGQYVLAGLLVSNGACLVLLATLYRYIALDHGPDLAREAVWWLLATPISFVLLIPYTEPLLLCFALLALWCARHDRWLLAGLCGYAAALAKQPGVVLVLPLLWEYVSRTGARAALRRWRTLYVLACLALIPLGYLSFSLYRALALGELVVSDPRTLLSSLLSSGQLDAIWGTRFGWPWEVVANVVAHLPGAGAQMLTNFGLSIAALLVLIIALRRERAVVVIYCLALLYLNFTLVLAARFDPLMGMSRRLMLSFPIFTQLARWSLRSRLRRVWLAGGLVGMSLLVRIFIERGFAP